jgi:hypothetical protein
MNVQFAVRVPTMLSASDSCAVLVLVLVKAFVPELADIDPDIGTMA